MMSAPEANDPISSETPALESDFANGLGHGGPDSLGAPIVLNLIDDADLLAQFCRESRGLLEEVESAVLALEQSPREIGPVEMLFRAFHTVKGGAAFLRLDAVHGLAHELESRLEFVRGGQRAVDSSFIELILASVDVLTGFLTEVEAQLNGVGPGRPIHLLGLAPHPLLSRLVTGPSVEEPAAPPTSSGPETPPASLERTPSIRVGDRIPVCASRLETALGITSDIRQVLLGPDAPSGFVPDPITVRWLSEQFQELDTLLQSLLWIPTEHVFHRMQRVVRDAAAKAGKPIRLATHGGETLLDRRWEKTLAESLMHLLRNAVDHGIESPSLRCDRGKPPTGEVTLEAAIQEGRFQIEVRDDGAGIATTKVLDRAIQRGWVKAGETPTESEIHEFLFRPGFSTADSVTELSGRGVGLDVVRSNVHQIGGSIDVRSEPGRGTRFRIQVPLPAIHLEGERRTPGRLPGRISQGPAEG